MIEYGRCQCGCGQPTSIAKGTDASKGWVKGEPIRYVRGHSRRKYHTQNEAFWANIKIGEPNECWEWQTKSLAAGYGLIWVGENPVTAHRFSYELHIGPVPDGLKVLHTCDNKICVNPAHLYAGTAQDNINDAVERRRVWDESGKHPSAKLSPSDIPIIRQMVSEGTLYKDVAAIYGVDATNIGCIIRGKTWKHI